MEGLDGLYLYFVALAQLYLLCVRFLLGRKVHLNERHVAPVASADAHRPCT